MDDVVGHVMLIKRKVADFECTWKGFIPLCPQLHPQLLRISYQRDDPLIAGGLETSEKQVAAHKACPPR